MTVLRIWLAALFVASFSNAATLQGDFYSSQREGSAPDQRQVWSPYSNQPMPPYGGGDQYELESSVMIRARHASEVSQPQRFPRIDLNHMALTLRFTSEMNRRLAYGISHPAITTPSLPPILTPQGTHHSVALGQRGGQIAGIPNTQWEQHQLQPHNTGGIVSSSGPVNVHPSKQWQRPISAASTTPPKPELTLFHAKAPRPTKKKQLIRRPRGCSQWGPDLEVFLKNLISMLEIKEDESAIVLALTMIYLDRACSAETHRTHNQAMREPRKCPNITPRTVHRLSVVALVIATKAVHGGTTDQYWTKLQALGIPLEQFEQMESWMMQAMGSEGLFVPKEHLYKWLQAWHETFSREGDNQRRQLVRRVQN